MNRFIRSLSFGHAALLAASILVAFSIWKGYHFPSGSVAWVYGALILFGLILDMGGSLRGHRITVENAVVQPVLLLLCILPMLWLLFEAWAGAYWSYFATGHLLPYSDASGWVCGAKSLVTLGELNPISSRRPLGICFLASLFAVTGQDYQQTLILLASLAGAATFFAARETWLAGGAAAAVVLVALGTLCMAPWLPLFMTETPGYIVGCTGYAYLLGGFRRRSFPRGLCGLGLLTLALMTRVGAIFAVPLLAAYLIYFFSEDRRDMFRKSLAVGAVCGFLMFLGPLMLISLAPEGAVYQGNLSYSLYGLAAGGKGWAHVQTVHPEVMSIEDDGERSEYIFALFRDKFAEDPSVFFATLLRFLGDAVVHFPDLLFASARPLPPLVPGILALIAFALLLYPAWRRKSPWGFLVLFAIGIVLSAPLVPKDSARFYAATFPLHSALAAASVALMVSGIRNLRAKSEAETEDTEDTAPSPGAGLPRSMEFAQGAFAGLLIVALIILPLLLSLRSGDPSVVAPAAIDRDSGMEELVFYHNSKSAVHVGPRSEGRQAGSGALAVSLESVVQTLGFGRELGAHRFVRPGDSLYEVFLPQQPHRDKVYFLFDSKPHGKPRYLKAVVRPLVLASNMTEPSLYRVESYQHLFPAESAGTAR